MALADISVFLDMCTEVRMTGRYMNRFKKDWIPEESLALMAFSKSPIHKLPNGELLNMGYERVTAEDLSNRMREIVLTGHYFNTHKNALFEIDELADMHYKGQGIHTLPDCELHDRGIVRMRQKK